LASGGFFATSLVVSFFVSFVSFVFSALLFLLGWLPAGFAA
jgi:hypothetical protein